MKLREFFQTLLILNSTWVFGQTLPLGYPAAEEALRRNQLNGEFDSVVTFMQQPITPVAHNKDNQLIFNKDTIALSVAKVSVKKHFQFHLLSPQLTNEFNSHNPYYTNNGSLLSARGLQSRITVGVYGRVGPLSFQFRPEVVWVENRHFEAFPEEFDSTYWKLRYIGWNQTDAYGSVGNQRQKFMLSGQSKIMLSYKYFGAAISSENIWWGPGKRNSLIMSNNSRGFYHLSIHSIKPINILIGWLEYQIIGAELTNNPFNPTFPSQFDSNPYLSTKQDENRYLSGLNINFQTPWIKGLTVGFSRTVQQYWSIAKENKNYLPIFDLFFKANDLNDQGVSLDEQQIKDQLLSVSARWLWLDANAEIYYQYGRNDAAWNARDFLMSPHHAASSLFGFAKLFQIKDRSFELSYEQIKLSQTVNRIVRDAGSWYWHSQLRQGYTQHGEVIGASIPVGSNQQHVQVNMVDGINRIGLLFERTVVDYDFAYRAFSQEESAKRQWVDISFGPTIDHKFKNILVSADLLHIRSLNYQWRGTQTLYDKGENISNLHFTVNLAYLIP